MPFPLSEETSAWLEGNGGSEITDPLDSVKSQNGDLGRTPKHQSLRGPD